MVKIIQKIKLLNFKKFQQLELNFDDKINILIGDNEAGKSTVLTALDLVMSGSMSKIESQGLENLFCSETIQEFLTGDKKIENLPELFIEVYLNEQNNPDLNGRNYSSATTPLDGLKLVCKPRMSLSEDIKIILNQEEPNFPFEFYKTAFTTFSGEAYSGYRKFIKHLFLDNTQINNEYATREYIKTMYQSQTDEAVINKHQNEYRKHKKGFEETVLAELNNGLDNYQFSIRTSTKANLFTDLTLTEDGIPIENKGKGRQCFVKTEFALHRGEGDKKLDTLLLEEPENHLSHINMKRLVQRIRKSDDKQMFVTTHSTLVTSRLGLKQAILFNSNTTDTISLTSLTASTADFFMKAPDNNILEFILSKKVILVEGDAEYILLESLFQNVTGETFETLDIHVISVDGTSFKRYLELSKLLGIETAVITDNDGNFKVKCVNKYKDFTDDKIAIFYDKNNNNRTFEISFYNTNKDICDELFSPGRRTLSPQEYMLENKAEVAFQLLKQKGDQLIAPEYIKEAIEWIKN